MRILEPSIAAFLGRRDDAATIDIAYEHARVVTTFVRAYTRGNGFVDDQPNDDLADVIVSAATRITANPEQTRQESIGEYGVSPVTFAGFTLPELTVLNLYRRRTA